MRQSSRLSASQGVERAGTPRPTYVEQFALSGGQTGLDVAQGFAPRQLRESHHAEQVGAVQGAPARVTVDDAPKGLPWNLLHDLRKQRLAHVHASLQAR